MRLYAFVLILFFTVNCVFAQCPTASPAGTSAQRCGVGTVLLAASGTPAGGTYKWYSVASGGTALYTGASYTTPSISSTTTYYVSAVSSSGCEYSARTAVTATIYPLPSITNAVSDPSICAGQVANILISNSASESYYYLRNDADNTVVGDFTPGNGGTVSLTANPASSTTYNIVVTNSSNCPAQLTDKAIVTVNALPASVLTTTSPTINVGQTGLIQVTGTVTGTSYLLRKNNDNSSAGPPLPGVTGGTITFSVTPGLTTVYNIWPTNSANTCSGDKATVTVKDPTVSETSNNYVRTYTSLKAQTVVPTLVSPKHDVQVVTQYVDRLGRPEQVVDKETSPSGKDMVTAMSYDNVGRLEKEYLPYATATTTGVKASAPFTDTENFYNAMFGSSNVGGTPFIKLKYEKSSLNRVIRKGNAGNDWEIGSGHELTFKYRLNGSDDGSIPIWDGNATDKPVIVVNSSGQQQFYSAGAISVIETTDENKNKVVEYKDDQGRVILKRVQAVANAFLPNWTHWANTFYIYDDFGNLRFVIQPEGIKLITSIWVISDQIRDNFVFCYNYDGRKRLIEKKIPGAGWNYIVYDKLDRQVLNQDANQRLRNEWSFTKYDVLNRPIITGIYRPGAKTRGELQADVNNLSNGAGYQNANVSVYSTPPSAGSSLIGTDGAFPTSDIELLTITYNDNYSSCSFCDPVSSSNPFRFQAESWVTAGAEPFSRTDNTKGQSIGAAVKILGSDTWIKTVLYYDNKYRVIQSVASNRLNGYDRVSMLYDFTGSVVEKLQTPSGYTAGYTNIRERFVYDHRGRLLNQYHKIGSNTEILLAKETYNELGQLVDKSLHSTDNGLTCKQSVDYRYNIRGWMTKINEADVTAIASGDAVNDYFGMELGYNNALTGTVATAQYNGNISAVQWSTGGGTATNRQSYIYGYDILDRMLTSSHSTYKWNISNGQYEWDNENGAYSENINSYDLNGNINGLIRKGNNGVVMDNLSYGYSGNQLNYVHDTGDPATGFVNGNTGADDYAYDGNGNLFKDKNKGINNNGDIKYNHLNLPSEITKNTGEKVKYIYDAAGRKVAQEVYGTNGTTLVKVTDYIGEPVYEGSTLKFIQHSEGRILPDGSNWEYQYHLEDHLGNVRVTFTTKTQVTETATATFETSAQGTEAGKFDNYPTGGYINTQPGNAHTGNNSEYLHGGYNKGQVGLAKSFSVMPGDVVQVDAYIKYNTPSSNTANYTNFVTSLLAAFNLSAPAPGETGTSSYGINTFGNWEIGPSGDLSRSDAIKAFVTIIIFDKDYNFIDVAYKAATSSGALVSQSYRVKESGYAYVYISNEHPYLMDTYFDDVTISHTPSQIVGVSDYYPFGLTFNSHQRENSVDQDYKFNGKEEQDELGINWLDYGARMYDPAICRWMVVDPLAELGRRWSPFNYTLNNPIRYIDPDGMIWKDPKEAEALKNKVQEKINGLAKDKADLQAKLNDKDKPLSDKQKAKIEGSIADIDARTASLEISKTDIDKLDADQDHTYDLVGSDGNKHHVSQGEDGVINIEGSNDALHVHEIRHVSLSLDSKDGLQFSSKGKLKTTTPTGEKDEITAYKAQYAYDPNSLPNSSNSMNSINRQYVGTILGSDGKTPVYPAINKLIQNALKQQRINKRNIKKQGNN